METEFHFTCCLIGEDNLLIQCAQMLMKEGHSIVAVVSPLSEIRAWATENKVPCFAHLNAAKAHLESQTFDYLFSIINNQILTAEILRLPKKLSINYHDAPLPRYAGVHATSWAILNGEEKHGITWHVINDMIDGGDILAQLTFPIYPEDTALTLNLRCFEYALPAFNTLIHELAHGTCQPIPQDLTQRTYYGLHKKPDGNAWIDWNTSAEDIDRLCRAFSLGHYKNAVSVPKFTLGGDAFIIEALHVLPQTSNKTPGSVTYITEEQWQIATRTNDIALTRLVHIDGAPCRLRDLAERYRLTTYTVLPSPKPEEHTEFEKTSAELSKHEVFWIDTWSAFQPAQLMLDL